MKSEEIKKKIENLISHSIEELEVESPKIDFKAKWYNLENRKGKGVSEFIKDVTSIANTVGLDGYIIIGFDEEKKTFHPAKFIDSGLKDSSEIPNLIVKNCSNLFDINLYEFNIQGSSISVLHIPPTLEKPIAILNHKTFGKDNQIKNQEQHRIFVRKGTSTRPASKYDIEMMFYDRKNILQKFQYSIDLVDIKLHKFNFSVRGKGRNIPHIGNILKTRIAIDNFGKRAIALKGVSLSLENSGESIKFVEKTIQIENRPRALEGYIFSTINKDTIVELHFSFEEKSTKRELKIENFSHINIGFSFSNGKKVSQILKINNGA